MVGDVAREVEAHNDAVRARETCQYCGGDVPDGTFPLKYHQAGGALMGPFCTRVCAWAAVLDGGDR